MGFFDSIERGLEKAVNGAFAKTFRSGVQPIDIASALKNELDTHTQILARDRIIVPNELTATVSREDFEKLSQLGSGLHDELIGILTRHAEQQSYHFLGLLTVKLALSERLTVGQLEVGSKSVPGEVIWVPTLELQGRRYPLRPGRQIIGRSSTADITVDDTGVSKHHAAIDWDGQTVTMTDLGSTNGTTVNGQKISQTVLSPDSVIRVGRIQGTFRLLPSAAPETSA